MSVSEATRINSRPLLIPQPDINSPQEENFAANKYLYDVATFAMYNRIQESRHRQTLYYGYNNCDNYVSSQCKKSFEDLSAPRRITNEAFDSFEKSENFGMNEQENEDDCLQFSFEV